MADRLSFCGHVVPETRLTARLDFYVTTFSRSTYFNPLWFVLSLSLSVCVSVCWGLVSCSTTKFKVLRKYFCLSWLRRFCFCWLQDEVEKADGRRTRTTRRSRKLRSFPETLRWSPVRLLALHRNGSSRTQCRRYILSSSGSGCRQHTTKTVTLPTVPHGVRVITGTIDRTSLTST